VVRDPWHAGPGGSREEPNLVEGFDEVREVVDGSLVLGEYVCLDDVHFVETC